MGGSAERAAALLNRGAIRQSFHPHSDGRFTIRTSQDVQPHLEYAHKRRRAEAEGRGKFGKRRDIHARMSVPENVILEVAQKLGIPFGRVFEKECSDRIWKELHGVDYKNFRTTNGRIGK